MMRHARAAIIVLVLSLALGGCGTEGAGATAKDTHSTPSAETDDTPTLTGISYEVEEYPLERAGIALHLARLTQRGTEPRRNILLVHGSTFSSAEFDIDYKDYSLSRFLARQGYAVWTLDIAGYGRSQEVADGFVPDTAYASEDVRAATDLITDVSGQEKVDVCGWSWGTMYASLFAKNHPQHLGRLILYGPILTGIGKADVTEPFGTNTWEGAAEDFQVREDGSFDTDMTDPVLIEMFCSACWHYDGDHSPNAALRDACVDEDVPLIDLEAIRSPTLVIHGDADPYLNYEVLSHVLDRLPEGSEHVVIEGASHALMLERPHYHRFQNALIEFLNRP